MLKTCKHYARFFVFSSHASHFHAFVVVSYFTRCHRNTVVVLYCVIFPSLFTLFFYAMALAWRHIHSGNNSRPHRNVDVKICERYFISNSFDLTAPTQHRLVAFRYCFLFLFFRCAFSCAYTKFNFSSNFSFVFFFTFSSLDLLSNTTALKSTQKVWKTNEENNCKNWLPTRLLDAWHMIVYSSFSSVRQIDSISSDLILL